MQDRSNNDDWSNEDEVLYRRHSLIGDLETLKLLPPTVIIDKLFEMRDDSYNRSSLSEPDDVVLNDNPAYPKDVYSKYGIISLRVGDIINNVKHKIANDSREFSLVPVHKPEDCNFSHTELHCFIDGSKAPKKPKSINSIFRELLVGYMDLVKEAS